MKICRNLLHLIMPLTFLTLVAAQADSAPGRILSLAMDPQSVTMLQLRPGFVTSVRLPEPVSSVVLGDPAAFKAEHSETEPELVFFKPSTSTPSRTNALITTRTGREVALALISRGVSDRAAPVDYVLKYERPRSFLVEPSHSSFVIDETRDVVPPNSPAAQANKTNSESPEDALLRHQQNSAPHWEGKQLRVSIGQMTRQGDDVAVGFSVINSSSKPVELLPPQVELTDSTNGRQRKAIKAEPVAIKNYRLTTRRLAPGERADGIVVFERPAFKQSSERLLLGIAQAEQVDHPVLIGLSFVPPVTGGVE